MNNRKFYYNDTFVKYHKSIKREIDRDISMSCYSSINLIVKFCIWIKLSKIE